jgi:hypothetical protein
VESLLVLRIIGLMSGSTAKSSRLKGIHLPEGHVELYLMSKVADY